MLEMIQNIIETIKNAEFKSIEVLWLLLLVPVVFWWLLRKSGRGVLGFSTLRDIKTLGISWRVRMRGMLIVFRVLCIALLIVALARPREGSSIKAISTNGVVMEVVVDISSSMNEKMNYNGENITRLDVVKDVLDDFIGGAKDNKSDELSGRENDLIGLVTFARFADTICPLVHAHDALLGFLAQTQTVKVRSEDGTAIGDGLMLAASRLKTAEESIVRRNEKIRQESLDDAADKQLSDFKIKSKVIVLLTDGVNNVGNYLPKAAALKAKEWGIKVYTIGIGSAQKRQSQGILSFSLGGPQLDEKLLKAIADATGGFYSRADNGNDLRRIIERINEAEVSEIESIEYNQYRELFAWPAMIALGLLIIEILLACTVLRKIP